MDDIPDMFEEEDAPDATPEVVMINGVPFTITATRRVVNNSNSALYPKASRDTMTPEKLNDLFDKAVYKTQTLYDAKELKIEDPSTLEDTYDLEMAITRTKNHHLKYDLHDVFTIVYPSDNTADYKFIDLYKDYSLVTEQDVAESNEWYATMTADPQGKWVLQNLKLTHEYLINNTEDELVQKVHETYYSYPVEQRGGPLFFKIMMDIIQNNSTESVDYLINILKNLKVTAFDGENINKVVSLVRGAVHRLTNLTPTGVSSLPKDLAIHLIKIFQTTSVPAFNAIFDHLYVSFQLITLTGDGDHASLMPQIEKVLKLAELQYRKLLSTNEWTGIHTKSNSVFTAQGSKSEPTCFNCGGAHSIKECTKPQDDARIKANRQKFWDAKNASNSTTKKSGGYSGSKSKSDKSASSTGKWAVPTDAEKKNQNRRIIDGKTYFYHFKTKRWKPVSTAASLADASVAETSVAPTPAPAPTNQATEIAVANATRQMEQTFRNLMAQF